MANKEKKGLNINTQSFITAILVIFALMIVAYILTLVIPGGNYARIPDENGNMIIDTTAGFSSAEGGLPFWKWVLSPFLVLGAEGSGTIIAVIAFLLVIGGVFSALEYSGLMKYMLEKMVARFGAVRYRLLAIVLFFFMATGSLIGAFTRSRRSATLAPKTASKRGVLGP